MSIRYIAVAMVMIALIFIAGCGRSELAVDPTPFAPTEMPNPPTATSKPPAPIPTQKPVPPTETPPAPTATPAPPTATLFLPAATPTPSPESALEPTSVADLLASLEGLPIDEFLRESWRQLQLRDPDTLFANGFADVYDVTPGNQFTSLSADYTRETQQLEREILDLLRAYDRGALSADQTISYDSLEWVLATRVRGHAFTGYKFLVNPVWGLQNWPIDLLMEHPLENEQDVENYMARLSSLDTWADQVIEGLKQNEQAGAIPPRYVLEDTIAQLDAILNLGGSTPRDADQIELYTDFRRRVHRIDDLSQDEREAVLDAAMAEIEDTFIPAYQALRDHLVRLTTIAVEDPNQWRVPGGKDYYAYLLAYYTGTNLSADEIHALGLAEVARLQADIRNAAVVLGYPEDISMDELNQRLDEESQIITGDALQRKYEEILTAADQAAEEYFDLRTSADVVVRAVQSGPPAYYVLPEPGSDNPGEMPVNLGFSPHYVNYNEYVLVHHETIPGHHTQLALAQELDLPGYQRFYSANPYLQNYDSQAYTEGWAWYAEVLAGEMGLYEADPLANLGRLRLHLIRTVRIVVDTGLHAKGWTLDEAAAYLEKVTGTPQSHDQLTRYLVNPGYPSGYTIGYLSILEMRQRAREKLADRFDIQEFHNIVLGSGILPICVLENVVDAWIAAGGPAEPISSTTPVTLPPPSGGGRIAFASERDGTLDIYVMDADSGSVTRLTNDPEHDSGPVWSPDGTRIAFMSERNANHDLYVMDASGSNVTRLTTDPADEHGATWSPDGARLAFTSNRSGNLDIYVMDTDGSNVVRLTDSPASDANAAWSPDGARIAFASDRDGDLDIYVMDTDGSNVSRLTDSPAQDVDPAWSPDGTYIIFASNRDSSDPADYSSPDINWEIYVMEADGSNAIRLTDNLASDIAARWSPDGRRIVFVSTRDGDMRIYVMDADGSNQARLTSDSATEESPAWSP